MLKPSLTLLALCAAVALPAAAQQDPAAARKEARNARGSQLTVVSPEQAQHNALQRCARLPEFYRVDCEARVRGQGQASGSVEGGGILRESVTTMPKEELDAQMRNSQPVSLPRPGMGNDMDKGMKKGMKNRPMRKGGMDHGHDHDHGHRH